MNKGSSRLIERTGEAEFHTQGLPSAVTDPFLLYVHQNIHFWIKIIKITLTGFMSIPWVTGRIFVTRQSKYSFVDQNHQNYTGFISVPWVTGRFFVTCQAKSSFFDQHHQNYIGFISVASV